jgi:hypothetical protein
MDGLALKWIFSFWGCCYSTVGRGARFFPKLWGQRGYIKKEKQAESGGGMYVCIPPANDLGVLGLRCCCCCEQTWYGIPVVQGRSRSYRGTGKAGKHTTPRLLAFRSSLPMGPRNHQPCIHTEAPPLHHIPQELHIAIPSLGTSQPSSQDYVPVAAMYLALVPPARLAAGSDDDVVEKEAANVYCFVCLYQTSAVTSLMRVLRISLATNENPAGHSSHPHQASPPAAEIFSALLNQPLPYHW